MILGKSPISSPKDLGKTLFVDDFMRCAISRLHFLAPAGAALLLGICACALVGSGESLTKAKGYQVTAPQAWKAEDAHDSDHSYRTASGAVVTLTSSCNRHSDASLDWLTRHLLLGARQVKIEKQEPSRLAGGDSLRSRARASLDGTPFHLDLLVLKRAGCVFDFTLLSPKAITADDESQFTAFIRSFRGKD